MPHHKHKTENVELKHRMSSVPPWVFFLPTHLPIERGVEPEGKKEGRKEGGIFFLSIFNEVNEYFASIKDSSKTLS